MTKHKLCALGLHDWKEVPDEFHLNVHEKCSRLSCPLARVFDYKKKDYQYLMPMALKRWQEDVRGKNQKLFDETEKELKKSLRRLKSK